MDDAAMREMMGLPMGFGKRRPVVSTASVSVPMSVPKDPEPEPEPVVETEKEPLTVPSGKASPIAEDAVATEEDDDTEEEDPLVDLPLTHQIALKSHSKTVGALTLDHSGGRLVSGSRDNTVTIWDFHSMDQRLRPFKVFEPVEGNPITDIQFGLTGDRFLLVTPEHRARLYSRDGVELGQFAKGDPYIRDPKRTTGHTAALTLARWHPLDKSTFLTAAADSTIRLWTAEDTKKQKGVIPVKSKLPGGRTPITAAGWSNDGRLIVGGGEDGALRIWAARGPYVMPSMVLENAHTPGMAISSAVFGKSHQHIVTRGMDDTLKLFDVRSFKKPLKVVTNLPNAFDSTNTVFSPDERFLLTGVSIQKSTQESGKIVVFDSTTLEPLSDIEVGPSASVVKLVWHSRINQVFAGLSNGTIQALYNPRTSAGGVTLSLTKQIHRKAVDDISYAFEGKEVRPPSEDLQFPEERGGDGKRNFAGFKKKPKGSEVAPRDLFKPVVPGRGGASGQGGQIGTSVTAYMMKSIMKDKTLNDDPREAILKYAQVAEEDPYWVAPAYQKNQPVAQYSKAVYEDEDEAKREAKKKRRQ